jgi:hypothetical protein
LREFIQQDEQRKGSKEIPRKKNPKRSHSRWLEQVTPAALDVVETADEEGEAVEDAVKLPQELCLARHQKSGPARTLKVISLQSALATRARMEICYALPWRRWQRK